MDDLEELNIAGPDHHPRRKPVFCPAPAGSPCSSSSPLWVAIALWAVFERPAVRSAYAAAAASALLVVLAISKSGTLERREIMGRMEVS